MLLHTLISIYIYNYAFYYFRLTPSIYLSKILFTNRDNLLAVSLCLRIIDRSILRCSPALRTVGSQLAPLSCLYARCVPPRSAAANSNLVYLYLDGRALQPLFAVPVFAKTESRRARKYMCTCTCRRLFAC